MSALTEPAMHRQANLPAANRGVGTHRRQPLATGTVGVGVGGSGAWTALAWAVDEVAGSGRHLVVVHVCSPDSPLAGVAGTPNAATVELHEQALARAVSAVRTRLGGNRVELQIRVGHAAAELIDASAGMDMLAIGAGASGRIVRRVLRGSFGPVVVVRGGSPGPDGPFAGHVVVGIDGSAAGQAACEFAFKYADEHGFPLAAVHVSGNGEDDYFYDETTLSTHFTVEPAALELLAAAAGPSSRKHPRVQLRRAVLHGTVTDGLVRAAAGAFLLVVGDKRRGSLSRARTGDVPYAVIRRASCPTAVVPVDRRVEESL
jgi:nucleotide-binding universal stress UspA family protein